MKIKGSDIPRNINPISPFNIDNFNNKIKCYYVGFDGCLAEYDRWGNVNDIGNPVPEMKKWILYWISTSIKVKIFTVRAGKPELIPPIRKWLLLNGFPMLEITNIIEMDCDMIFDNNARETINNTGIIVDRENGFNPKERNEFLKRNK